MLFFHTQEILLFAENRWHQSVNLLVYIFYFLWGISESPGFLTKSNTIVMYEPKLQQACLNLKNPQNALWLPGGFIVGGSFVFT